VIPLVRQLRPDVVAMDVRMPLLDGIEAARAVLRTVDAPPKILVVTTFGNDEYVYEALRAGAYGFLLKRARPAEIVHAVRLVSEGESLLFPASVRRLAAEYGDGGGNRAAREVLDRARRTEREAEVLRLMAHGLSNAEIAARLIVGTETVKSHVSAVLAKSGARDRTQAVITAYASRGSWRPADRFRARQRVGDLSVRALAGVRHAEYHPANTRTSWEDGRWGGLPAGIPRCCEGSTRRWCCTRCGPRTVPR
jgi:DNA-binding NarL/FixJ family response regulator